MAKVTITEALAELKTIDRRLVKKREHILGVCVRQEAFKDPLLADGGSAKFIAEERQSIADLESRRVAIRVAINRVNLETNIALATVTMNVAEWLVWRREVANGIAEFHKALRGKIEQARKEAQARGYAVVADPAAAKVPTDLIVNVDEAKLLAEIEKMEDILGSLDGQLSLKNATVMVEVPDGVLVQA